MDGEWEAAKIDNPKCQEAPGKCEVTYFLVVTELKIETRSWMLTIVNVCDV